MQDPSIETSLCGCGDRCEAECEEQVSTHAVVFVDGLGIVHTSIDARGVVLRYSHNSLNCKKNIRNQSKDAVRGGEVGASMGKFVVLNYYESGEEGQNGGAICDGVYVGAEVFLLRGMCRLEDQDGLRAQKQASGVKQL